MFDKIKLKIRQHCAKDIVKFVDDDIEFYRNLTIDSNRLLGSLIADNASEEEICIQQEARDMYFHKYKCMKNFKWRLEHYNIL